MSKPAPTWSVANAKARFSELIDRAQLDGPQTITRNGRETVVVVSVNEWNRRTRRKQKLGDFLANSPLRGSGLKLDRPFAAPRDIEL